jgi:sec-independent protein translocase protein TatC
MTTITSKRPMTNLSFHFYEIKLRFFYIGVSMLCTFLIFSTHQLEIIYIIGKPFINLQQTFIFLELTEALSTLLQVSAILTSVVVFAFVIYHFWSFVIPSFYKKQQQQKRMLVSFFIVVLFCEILVTYFLLLPIICNFLLSFELDSTRNTPSFFSDTPFSQKNEFVSLLSVEFSVRITSYIHLVLKVFTFLFLVFQLPFCICYLYSKKIIEVSSFYFHRKIYSVIALLLAAVVVPPDFLMQLVVALIFYILFEFFIFIGFFF